MKHVKPAVLLVLLFAATAIVAAPAREKFRAAKRGGIPNRYLVVLDDDHLGTDRLGKAARASGVLAELGVLYRVQPREVWTSALRGFAVVATEAEARRLAADPKVRFVEQDASFAAEELLSAVPWCTQLSLGEGDPDRVTSLPKNTRAFPTSPQSLICANTNPTRSPECVDNWGLDRTDQAFLPRNQSYVFNSTGAGVHVYVMDSGIKATHRELGTRVGNGFNAVNAGSLDDCISNHHGTAVASIIAGATYGIAKAATIHPVKVVDACLGGGGTAGTYVTAFNWIAQNHQSPAVANLSGANRTNLVTSPSFVAAARGMVQSGVSFVQSAGNQGEDASAFSVSQYPDPTYNVAHAIVVGAVQEIEEGTILLDGRWVADASDPSYQDVPYQTPSGAFRLRVGFCRDSAGTLKPNHDQCGSNHGQSITIWAPGAWITSAGWDDTLDAAGAYCSLTGTSMAAPHVTGIIARYLQSHPTATPQQVKAALLAAARPGVLVHERDVDDQVRLAESPAAADPVIRVRKERPPCGGRSGSFQSGTGQGSGCTT
jgi:subtilisin family serine protease